MSLIEYPTDDYNSWISEDDADGYFETRLNADPWDACQNKEAALMTGFRTLNELDLNIVFDDDKEISSSYYTATQVAEILKALQESQCEQALYELINDTEGSGISGLSLGGLLSVKISENKTPPPRFSPRALAVLRPYLSMPTTRRTR